MASIYTKGSEKTLILSPREAVNRQFDFGTDWTEVRVGMFVGAVAGTGPNDEVVAETVTINNFSDRCIFGIKNTGQTLPGEAGSLFLGVRSAESSVTVTTPHSGIGSPSGGWHGVGYHDTTQVDAAGGDDGSNKWGDVAASGGSAYAMFFGIQLVINNIGTSSQSVDVKVGATSPFAGTDYSAINLRTTMNNFNFAGLFPMTVPWNTGSAARVIPDCAYVRASTFLNRIRISAIEAIRYAP